MINYQDYIGYKGADPDVIRADLRDALGRKKTASLFEESINGDTRANGHIPLYSLRDYENNGKPSAYRIYINSIDEADAAQKLVGSYEHWRKLCSLKWFVNGWPEWGFDGLSKWRQDMAERDKTLAKNSLVQQVLAGNVTAARALHKMAEDSFKQANKILPSKGRGGDSDTEEVSSIVNFLSRSKE